MWILGIAGSHNGAVSLVHDGKVAVAVQAERVTRAKRQPIDLTRLSGGAAPVIRYCLDAAGIDWQDLDMVATCTPWAFLYPRFNGIEGWDRLSESQRPNVVTVPHHLAHAEYAIHYAPVDDALVLVADGSGSYEWSRLLLTIQEQKDEPIQFLRDFAKESISAYSFKDQQLRLVYRVGYGFAPGLSFLESLGHIWRWAAVYCHGSPNEAGKVMGLAPFGDPRVFQDLETIRLAEDGEVFIDYGGLSRANTTPNVEGADITGQEHYAHVAAHIQHSTNDFLLRLSRFLHARSPSENLCYSGGVALNGIANQLILSEGPFRSAYMGGSCEDNGTAIGAALAAYHWKTGKRQSEPMTDYYGREYSSAETGRALASSDLPHSLLSDDEMLTVVARALSEGQIVGWHQGRSEFGPRALGNRSILADSRSDTIKDALNYRIKKREGFRPFAPAVLQERAAEYFDLDGISPMMLRVVPTHVRTVPSVVHIDDSARVQTVSHQDNPKFHALIERFGVMTGVPVVLNTSFNIAGDPIVETPENAIDTFKKCGMDLLALGNYIVRPRESS